MQRGNPGFLYHSFEPFNVILHLLDIHLIVEFDNIADFPFSVQLHVSEDPFVFFGLDFVVLADNRVECDVLAMFSFADAINRA
jgi:hypothetical protein